MIKVSKYTNTLLFFTCSVLLQNYIINHFYLSVSVNHYTRFKCSIFKVLVKLPVNLLLFMTAFLLSKMFEKILLN